MPCFPIDKWRAVQLVAVDPDLNNLAKSLFVRLMGYHNTKTLLCFPSEATLAVDLNCSERTVRNGRKSLEKSGYVRTLRGKARNGANQYILKIPKGKNAYEQAAKECLKKRKNNAAKPMKQPMKELTQTQRYQFSDAKIGDDAIFAKNQRNIERELTNQLGNDQEAWEKILCLADEIENAAKTNSNVTPNVAEKIACSILKLSAFEIDEN